MNNRPVLDQEYLNKLRSPNNKMRLDNLIAVIQINIDSLSALFKYRDFSLSSVETLIEKINKETCYFGHPDDRERFKQERANIRESLTNALLGPSGAIAFASGEYQNYEQLRDALNLIIDKEKGLEIIKSTGILKKTAMGLFESAISDLNAAIKARYASRVNKAPNRLSTGHETEKRKEKIDDAVTEPAPIPKKSQEELNTALFSAISNNEFEQVQRAIDAGADVNCRNKNRQSPLVYAYVTEKSKAIFEFLINNQADVNVTMPYGNDTILDRVVITHNIDYAAFLLDHKAQPGAGRGQKIWFDAARQSAMLGLLMRKGVKIDWSCLNKLFTDSLSVFNGIVSLIENEITKLVASLTKLELNTKDIIEILNHYIDYISGTEKIFKEKRAALREVLVQRVEELVADLNRYSNVELFKARLTLVMTGLRLITDGHFKKQSMKKLEACDRQLDKTIKHQMNYFVGLIQGGQVDLDQVDKLLAAGFNLEANCAAILDVAILAGSCYIFQSLVERGMNVHREIKPGLTPIVRVIQAKRFDILSYLVEIKRVEIDWNGLKNNKDSHQLASLVAEHVASLISPATVSNIINTRLAITRINQKTIYLPEEPELRAVFSSSIRLALDAAILSTVNALEATKNPKTVLPSLQALMKDICPPFRVTGPAGAKVFSFISSLRNRLNAELLQAAEKGDYKGVMLAIENGADVDCKNSEGLTPLCLAARHSHLPIIEQLIHLGAVEVGGPTRERTVVVGPAVLAASPSAEVVNLPEAIKSESSILNAEQASALQPTVDLEAKDANGYTALMNAARFGRIDEVRALLKAGASIDWGALLQKLHDDHGLAKTYQRGYVYSILHALVQEDMNVLVDSSADQMTDELIKKINSQASHIHHSGYDNDEKRKDIRKYLVDVFEKKHALKSNPHLFSVLDKVLAGLNIIEGKGGVKGMKAAMYALRLLRVKRMDEATPLDPFGELISGDESRVLAAIHAGADVNGKNAAGMTPLVFLSRYSDPETLKLLIEHGAEIDLIRLAVLELPDPNNSKREIKVLDAILATIMERVKVMEAGFVKLLEMLDTGSLVATQKVISDAVNFIEDKIKYLSMDAVWFGKQCSAVLAKENPGWSRKGERWHLGQFAFDYRLKLAVDCLFASLKNVKEKWSAVIDKNKLLLLQANLIKLSAITKNNEWNEFFEARLVGLKAVSRVSGSSVTLFGEHARAASAPTAPQEDPRYSDPWAGL